MFLPRSVRVWGEKHERGPELRLGGKTEAFGSDADDAERTAIEHQRAADRGRIAAELGLPETMGNDGGGFVILRSKESARQRMFVEEAKEIRRDGPAQQTNGAAADFGGPGAAFDCGGSRERSGERAHFAVLDSRDGRMRRLERIEPGGHRHHAAGVADAERVQQHGLEHTDNGRVGAHAERHGQHCGGRHHRLPPQQPDGEDRVAPGGIEPREAPLVVALLAEGEIVAELAAGGQRRFGGRHAFAARTARRASRGGPESPRPDRARGAAGPAGSGCGSRVSCHHPRDARQYENRIPRSRAQAACGPPP